MKGGEDSEGRLLKTLTIHKDVLHRKCTKITRADLDDYFQSLHFLVRGPGVLQRLVELLYAVHVILLSQVQQLLLGALWAERRKVKEQTEKH